MGSTPGIEGEAGCRGDDGESAASCPLQVARDRIQRSIGDATDALRQAAGLSESEKKEEQADGHPDGA